MNTEEFREHAKAMVDFICEHRDTVDDRCDIVPLVEPGYMTELIPCKSL